MKEKQKDTYAILRNGKPCYKNSDLRKVLDKFKSLQMSNGSHEYYYYEIIEQVARNLYVRYTPKVN
jgi:hypothetical protein